MSRLSTIACGLAAFAALAGCAAPGPVPKTDSFLINRAGSEFYKYGPAQTFGPDSALKKGEHVTMVRRDFGFSQIRLDDGTLGYVATEDLKAAPPPPAPPRPRTPPRRGSTRSSHVRPTPGDPLFDVTDIPLPLPTGAEKKP